MLVTPSAKRDLIVFYSKVHAVCREMHANEMHELYDRHHKMSPNLNSY